MIMDDLNCVFTLSMGGVHGLKVWSGRGLLGNGWRFFAFGRLVMGVVALFGHMGCSFVL